MASGSGSLLLISEDIRNIDESNFWFSDLDLVYVSTDYMIAVSKEELSSERCDTEVLDCGDIELDNYVLVHITNPQGLESASELGDILFQREKVVLIRLTGELPEPFIRDGVFFVQPLRVQKSNSERFSPPFRSSYDDYVADIVSAVDELGYQGFIQDLEDFETRYSSTDNYDSAAQYCLDTFESYGIDGFLQEFSMASYNCVNVVTEKPGSENPDIIYIICGHLDSTSPVPLSLAPGADDNASGASAVLEAARIMSGYDFKYTIRFLCFGGEEQGLWGSEHYASQAASAGDDIQAVVNLDMVLYAPPDDDVLWVPYNTQSHSLALALEAICDTYVSDLNVSIEYSPGSTYSDHASFWNNGYAAVLGIEQEFWSNPYYHQTTDILANYMSYFPFGTDCIKGAIATVAYLAEPLGPTSIENTESFPGMFEIISLFPNPTTGLITLEIVSSIEENFCITIYDLNGRIQETLGNIFVGEETDIIEMNISDLNTGLYLLRVEASGTVETRKVALFR